MEGLDDLEFLSEYREDNRIEAKRAQGGLPHSLWETYSAFANTLGGVILLGVAEAKDGSLYSVPLLDPEELVEEFWSIVQDPKLVSANVLRTGRRAADAERAEHGGGPSLCPGQISASGRCIWAPTPIGAPTTAVGKGTGRSRPARGGGDAPRPGKRLSVGRIARTQGGALRPRCIRELISSPCVFPGRRPPPGPACSRSRRETGSPRPPQR